jgi:hypothetical protein
MIIMQFFAPWEALNITNIDNKNLKIQLKTIDVFIKKHIMCNESILKKVLTKKKTLIHWPTSTRKNKRHGF